MHHGCPPSQSSTCRRPRLYYCSSWRVFPLSRLVFQDCIDNSESEEAGCEVYFKRAALLAPLITEAKNPLSRFVADYVHGTLTGEGERDTFSIVVRCDGLHSDTQAYLFGALAPATYTKALTVGGNLSNSRDYTGQAGGADVSISAMALPRPSMRTSVFSFSCWRSTIPRRALHRRTH
ncbi:hypothetical protein PHLGIDRAFT_321639 [Phlebiopsis gigantea 11061_1 CR5-6]|uniref:Uncharacterized protein n=1 Tax=Phlebiopsis gigantea (strain 11061_1 CR5-6) TaxID=745531 RepID=A0A0C3NBQ8_PHLG1|nr:hypothetical protein PHLGIDRAFT_321639 [Phlebiopsis gigantea 11061_1 CR5-6]